MGLMTSAGYQQYWQMMIRDMHPTHEVTLAYNNHGRGYAIGLDQVRRDLQHLHGLVDRRLYGPRFYKRKPVKRTSYIGCVEHKDSNLHVHLAWRVPQDNRKIFERAIAEIWCSPSRSTTVAVKRITDLAGWAQYMTKDLDPQDPDADLMVTIG